MDGDASFTLGRSRESVQGCSGGGGLLLLVKFLQHSCQ